MFLYFLPKVKAAKPDVLQRFGLSDVIEGKPITREMPGAGPGGNAGLFICNGFVDQVTLSYDAANQTWQQRIGSEAWIGLPNDRKPTPTQLARSQQVAGEWLQLADGNRYLIPKLRSFDANQLDGPFRYSPNLDQTLTQDPKTGDLVPGDVVPKYSAIWDEAIALGDRLLDQLQQSKTNSASLTNAEIFGFAARILGVNYRVGNAEIAMAGLLQTDLAVRIMHLAIDWDTLRANLGNRLRRASLGTPTTTPATASA